MNIETAKKVENLLYELKKVEGKLKDLQQNIDEKSFSINGSKTIYFTDEEKKEVGLLLVNFYEEKIKDINNQIEEL